jgi:gluconate 5-dehydrogenase
MATKTAVITGASSGIGFSVAEAFIGQGANVVLNGRDEAKLAKAAGEARQSGSHRHNRRRHHPARDGG